MNFIVRLLFIVKKVLLKKWQPEVLVLLINVVKGRFLQAKQGIVLLHIMSSPEYLSAHEEMHWFVWKNHLFPKQISVLTKRKSVLGS